MSNKLLLGRYEKFSIIGMGGMARVYRGRDTKTGMEIAIKMLRVELADDDVFVNRFRKESQIASKYSHPNFVNTIDVGETDEGIPFIVMEYVKGCTLKDVINSKGKLDANETIRIAMQVCDALRYAHNNKLIHRDIKPQNILIREDGIAKVADFGIAKAIGSNTTTMSDTSMIGSVHYISPEHARGGYTDEKSDIYSLGIMLFEMITGTVPFKSDTPVSIAIKHMQEKPVNPSKLNPDIYPSMEQVILKAIEKERYLRYASVDELAHDLRRVIDEPYGDFVERGTPIVDGIHKTNINTVIVENPSNKKSEKSNNSKEGKNKLGKKAKRKRKNLKQILKLLAALFLVIGVFITFFLVVRSIYLNAYMDDQVAVPSLVGLDIEKCKSTLIDRGLRVEFESVYSETVPANSVISQNPSAEENILLNKGDTVMVVISLGPEKGISPDVIETHYERAVDLITNAGFKVGDITREANSQLPPNYVISQDPQPNIDLEFGSKISLIIVDNLDIDYVEMPALHDMNKNDALELLTGLGLDTLRTRMINSELILDSVVRTEPEAGIILKKGSAVTLWISSGNAIINNEAHIIFVNIEKDSSYIRVELQDNGYTQTVFSDVYNKGEYEILLSLESIILGSKKLIIYINNTEAFQDEVNFDGE